MAAPTHVGPAHIAVCQTVLGPFLDSRGLELCAPSSGANVPPSRDPDVIRRTLTAMRYFRVDARRREGAAGGAGGSVRSGRTSGSRGRSARSTGQKSATAGPDLTVAVMADVPWNGTDVAQVLPAVFAGGGREVILIAGDGFHQTPALKKVAEIRDASDRHLLALTFHPFGMNPLESALTPPQELLEKEVSARLLKEVPHMSAMFETDPVAVWLGASPGDVVRIAGRSNAGRAYRYRHVRAAPPLVTLSK